MLVRAAAEDHLNIRRLAMISLDKMLGWFPHTHRLAMKILNRAVLGALDGISIAAERFCFVHLWCSSKCSLFKDWCVVSCISGTGQFEWLRCSGTVPGSDRLSNGPHPKWNRQSLDDSYFQP